jgi:hypothetical protein
MAKELTFTLGGTVHRLMGSTEYYEGLED